MPWKSPSSQPTSWACAIRSSLSDGVWSSENGRVSRSSSSISSGARPASSSWIEAWWISLSRLRLASSSGAAAPGHRDRRLGYGAHRLAVRPDDDDLPLAVLLPVLLLCYVVTVSSGPP